MYSHTQVGTYEPLNSLLPTLGALAPGASIRNTKLEMGRGLFSELGLLILARCFETTPPPKKLARKAFAYQSVAQLWLKVALGIEPEASELQAWNLKYESHLV